VIPTLLWRCPACRVDDALRHDTHWFKNHEVHCTCCGTVWGVQRVIGNDYLLTVVRGDPSTIGQQRPLAEWYEFMKAGVKLAAREAPSVCLEGGEEVYVQSGDAQLFVEADSPLFGSWDDEEAPWQRQGNLGLYVMKRWDKGRLSLTNGRFIWAGSQRTLSFRFTRVNSAYTENVTFFGLFYRLRTYKVSFREESVLKWLTYTALAAQRLDHHRIILTNY